MEQVKSILWRRGSKALEIAKQSILLEKIEFEPLQSALQYFMEEFWEDVLHPALISFTCEAVGGNADVTNRAGAALVLLAGGADVHDDIIDHSKTKDSKLTVFGKFGEEIAILAGDALLFKGVYMLHDACGFLPENQRQRILDLTNRAFVEISSVEAREASLRHNFDLTTQQYLEIIRTKVSVAELATKIGAILGGGTHEEVETWGHFGRSLGILFTIRDEFIDMFELDELENRFQNECLPLPILAAFEEPEKKKEIISLLKTKLTEETIEKVLDAVMTSKGARELKKLMRSLVIEESQRLRAPNAHIEEATLLLQSSLEDL